MSDNTSAFHVLVYDEKIKKTLPYYEEFYKQVVDIVKIRFDKSLTFSVNFIVNVGVFLYN